MFLEIYLPVPCWLLAPVGIESHLCPKSATLLLHVLGIVWGYKAQKLGYLGRRLAPKEWECYP